MTILLSERRAFGQPGIVPRWTRRAKDAVGTAYADSSRVWFTVARGMLNEVYFPLSLVRPSTTMVRACHCRDARDPGSFPHHAT